MKSSGFFIIFKHDFHSADFGFLFLSTSIVSFQCPAIKYITEPKTASNPNGGEAKDLIYWKSCFLIVLRAAKAYSTKGPAASKAACVEVFFYSTSLFILAQFSYSIVALAFSTSTIAFSAPTISAKASA